MNKNIFIIISKIIFISLFTSTIFLFSNRISHASDNKDLILILDTSYTMAGYGVGGKNILPQVKRSLPQFIEQLNKNDSITLITFETEVHLYPTIFIGDKKNKESLIEYINNIEAKGKWTYTSQMMREAFKKAQELELKGKDRQRVIIILTDTLDDPPPEKRKDRLNIKDVAKNFKNKDWFIFFINFGQELKDNAKLAQMQKDLSTSVSKFTKVIETTPLTEDNKKITGKAAEKATQKNIDKGIKKTVEKDLPETISKMDKKVVEEKKSLSFSFPFKTLIIVLLIIAIILAIIYYFTRYASVKVKGKLEYWDHTMITPYYENYDLTKQNVKEILVGPKNTHNLTIRDIEITDPFKITAIRVNREIKNTLQAGKGYIIEHVNREPGGYLKKGDMFKVANYTFKFHAE